MRFQPAITSRFTSTCCSVVFTLVFQAGIHLRISHTITSRAFTLSKRTSFVTEVNSSIYNGIILELH